MPHPKRLEMVAVRIGNLIGFRRNDGRQLFAIKEDLSVVQVDAEAKPLGPADPIIADAVLLKAGTNWHSRLPAAA